MGCDIHIEVFIKMSDGKHVRVMPPPRWTYNTKPSWQNSIESYDIGCSWPDERNYGTFGLLAGVRYAHGSVFFKPTGLPSWARTQNENDKLYDDDTYDQGGVNGFYDYGDHTFTCLTLAQLRVIPWDEHAYREYGKSEFERVFIPMLEKIESFGVSSNNIFVIISFDS